MMKTLILLAMMLSNQSKPRQVLLFFDKTHPQLVKMQMDTLAPYQKEMEERELILHSYEKKSHSKEWEKWNVDDSSPFTFILIGKDGGEKFRSEEIVGHEKLFGLVDAMPMRRYELKRKN